MCADKQPSPVSQMVAKGFELTRNIWGAVYEKENNFEYHFTDSFTFGSVNYLHWQWNDTKSKAYYCYRKG